jgi:hypothetical protein
VQQECSLYSVVAVAVVTSAPMWQEDQSLAVVEVQIRTPRLENLYMAAMAAHKLWLVLFRVAEEVLQQAQLPLVQPVKLLYFVGKEL